ncbi:MAG: MFS transporter [Burkholderiales bacterium]|nr:MFS transporter [Burkholderiales bacterium]
MVGSPARFTAWLCVAQVGTMLGYATYPTLLGTLQAAWGMSNTEAGVVSGAYFGGYMLAVPILTALTDRIDARRIHVFACVLSAIGSFGFAVFAGGFASAALFQALVGMGLAGTYMPGLRILSDRVGGPRQSRYVSFYTTSFTVGASVSFLLPLAAAPLVGWRGTFAITGLGPVIAALMVLRIAPLPLPVAAPGGAALLDFRPVLANKPAMGYILAYTAHCWELLGSRSWLVAFLAFAAGLSGGTAPAAPAVAAAVINLLGMPASILGNELAMRFGRARVILVCMLLSGAASAAVGFTASLPWFLVAAIMALYTMLVMADSSSLTAGTVAAAAPDKRGITLALHSTLGFGAGMVSPTLFGWILDRAGGNGVTAAWGLAYASQGMFCLLAPLLAWAAHGSRASRRQRR